MHSFYLNAIRNFEGFTQKAQWDYAQHTNGYGTRALFPGEVIDKAEAERRFQSEISAARSVVEKTAPDLDDGTKAALTSLTYNAGTSWIGSGLGDAVRRGDLEATREIFQKYNKAGGEVLPGLVSRRSQEALWIGNPGASASGVGAGGNAGALDVAEVSLPPVVVGEAEAATASAGAGTEATSTSAALEPGRASAGAFGDPFVREPRAESPRSGEAASRVSADVLIALVESEGLRAGGGAAEIARLAQLGRGSDLANRDRERSENETRRV